MSNGKGDTPRPFSVPQETYASNWDKVFGKKNDECAYSGLPSTASYDGPPIEYTESLQSGMFWELFPGLTGNWQEDKVRWFTVKTGHVLG